MKKPLKILLIVSIVLFTYTSSFSQSRKAQELADYSIRALFKKAPAFFTEKDISITYYDVELEDGRYYMDIMVVYYAGPMGGQKYWLKGSIAVDQNGCNCVWKCTDYSTTEIVSGKRSRQELGCVK